MKPMNEDGHTDVPSAIRKLKLSIEDSQELLQKLESMDKESSLPAWWTDKITIAADYIDTADDYINTEVEEVDEGKLNERLKRFKVFVSGEKEPLILLDYIPQNTIAAFQLKHQKPKAIPYLSTK